MCYVYICNVICICEMILRVLIISRIIAMISIGPKPNLSPHSNSVSPVNPRVPLPPRGLARRGQPAEGPGGGGARTALGHCRRRRGALGGIAWEGDTHKY